MGTEVTLRTGDMIALGIYLVVIIGLGVRAAVKNTDIVHKRHDRTDIGLR